MGSPPESEYFQWTKNTSLPSFLQGQRGDDFPVHHNRDVELHYHANLSNAKFTEVQTRINRLGGNPQVEGHPTRPNVYVVTISENLANDSMSTQILQVFKSQDATATRAPAI